MKQREILNDIAPDFARNGQTQEAYVVSKARKMEEYIARYVRNSGMEGIVLGISGGVDSFLVGALCAQAMRDAQRKLYLLILPNGDQADFDDAQDSITRIQEIFPEAATDTVNIQGAYNGAIADLLAARGFTDDVYTLGNLQPRIRMMHQYALAKRMLVAGTDHATESITGFFTKYGDGGTDFNPIQELIKDDIYDMAAYYGAPKEVLKKPAAAGLGITKDDESELGIKYADICAYLRGNVINPAVREKLERMYDITRHKRAVPASMKDEYAPQRSFTILAVDFIHAFIDGALACQNAEGAVKETISFINAHPEANVLYVRDFHPKNHCSFAENGGKWPAHAVEGTQEVEFPEAFYTEIKKTVNTPIMRYNVFQKGMDAQKEQYSGFEAKNEAYGAISDGLAKKVVVVGAATEYCVLNTVKDLVNAGHEVWLMGSCLAYVEKEGHEQALEDMRGLGAKVIF